MDNFANKAKHWRDELEKVGGWDNEMVSVPGGSVRKIIEDLQSAAAEIDRLTAEARAAFDDAAKQAMHNQTKQADKKLPEGETGNIHISDGMMAAGFWEYYKNRDFEHDWEVIARIYGAMRAKELEEETRRAVVS
jgi:hypothetical protein